MWKKHGDFEPGSDFGAWARAVLYRTAMNHVRARKRGAVLCDIETLEALSGAFEAADEMYDDRRLMDALDECMGRLSPKQRRLLELRYWENKRSAQLGTILGKSVSAIDVTLLRVRRRLERCIRTALTTEV